MFRSRFNGMYGEVSKLRCEQTTLKEVMGLARGQDKPCAVLVSSRHKLDRGLLGLLNNNELTGLLVQMLAYLEFPVRLLWHHLR